MEIHDANSAGPRPPTKKPLVAVELVLPNPAQQPNRSQPPNRGQGAAMNSRRGFTLLEMLLATVLSVMLMVGVLAVIAGLGTAASKAGDQPVPAADAIDGWLRLLQEDLNLAVKIDASRSNELTLTGYAALDEPGRERTHRPARVLYRFEDVGGRRWLIRRQALLDLATNQNVQRDLVCSGLSRFELVPTPMEAARSDLKSTLWRLRM